MSLSEKQILNSVKHNVQSSTLDVEWLNQILRDEEVVSSIPHNKAYSKDQKDEFVAEVEGAEAYIIAAGW